MPYVHYNPNPFRLSTRDCAVRAISAVLNLTWDDAYDLLAETGKGMGLMMDDKAVTKALLMLHGFRSSVIPDTCPDCYTVAEFARDHPYGVYVVTTSDHVVAVRFGDWLDAWNSGDEVALYYWKEER